ncbi:MAG TPA: DUF1992 domain-containing protein [Acidimicrobiales bacterium]|jgi:hypothetical protein|nr:DUF1992 domain-containing protein [Acidimicrobiales bacterium]
MTERKPPNMRFETWIDQQIREAQERGEFENLPGKGKPISDLDRPYDEMWWIRQKLQREELSFVPPSVALTRKVDAAKEALRAARSEEEVRAIVEAVNPEIREANRKPLEGPPTAIMPFDVERTVARWRERQASAGG